MEASWWKNADELDDDQKKVIALADGENHVVVGPPGCGKTNLLLLRASYLHAKSVMNIKVLAFGRNLKEFIAAGTDHYPFDPEKVQTLVRWAHEILEANGAKVDTSGEFDEVRQRIFEGLALVAEKGLVENVYDVILLDEAQDYSAQEVEIITKFATRIYAVGDNNQRITEQSGALEKLIELGAKKTTLKYHYRNGIKICRVADGIKNVIDRAEGMEATSNYDEGTYPSTVDVVGGKEISEQLEELIARVQTQLQAYPGEMIGILCPRAVDLEAVTAVLEASALSGVMQIQKANQYQKIDPNKPVMVSSVHGAKGLEFRAVHLVEADKLKNFAARQKNLTYTAVTRAKTSLVIYHDKNLPGYFEKGLSACEISKAAEPALKDLFNG